MIIQLNHNISQSQKEDVLVEIEKIGYKISEVKTQFSSYIICIGNNKFDIRSIGNKAAVKDIHIVDDVYQLVSRKWKVNDTILDLGDDVKISRENFSIMSGPCSIENEKQIIETVEHLVKNGIKIMRGGVFKPRSTPYSFRGLGIDGLKIFYKHCKDNGIKVITEVMEVSQIDKMIDYVDIFQIGTRNSQNFNLLDAIGQVDKPVLLKRGFSGTIEELLHSAEYIFSNGNEKIILCERGIRTFEKAYRNTLDLNVVPILKEKSHLPVIVDPSHGVGIRKYVEPMALAAVMCGADGVSVEVHKQPSKAFSDGQQSLDFQEAELMYKNLNMAYKVRKEMSV